MATSKSSRQVALEQIYAFWCIHRDRFAFRKIDRAFPMIGIYQPHNQNIAVMNAYRRTIGLTEDKYLSSTTF